MSTIKRWAKAYLSLSPIANSPFFFTPHNEALIEINSRLLAAYWIKMYKHRHYDQPKIKQLIQKKGAEMDSYWLKVVRQHVLLEKVERDVDEEEEFDILKEDKEQFRLLVKKFYTKEISEVDFARLCQLYSQLTVLSCDRNVIITEMDNYLIDHSFFQDGQILSFVEMGHEAALDAVDAQALSFLDGKIIERYTANVFSFIKIIQAVKGKIKTTSCLSLFYHVVAERQSYQEIVDQNKDKIDVISRIAIIYMLWLSHLRQLGPFIFAKVIDNQSLQQYYRNSMSLTHQLLKVLGCYDEMPITDMIILNEVVFRLQQMQQKVPFFENVKENIAMEATLRKNKEKLQEKLHKFDAKQMKNEQWIDLLTEVDIEYQSSHSIGTIKRLAESLILNPYFKIVVEQQKRKKLIALCQKINSQELVAKIIGNSGMKKETVANCLLESLQAIMMKEEIKFPSIKIRSIFELAKIKELLRKGSKSKANMFSSFSPQDQLLLKKLQTELIRPSKQSPNAQKTSFGLIFDEFRL